MKQLKIILCVVLFISQGQAWADATDAAVGTAVAVGAVFAIIGAADSAVSPLDLAAFVDSDTNSTSKINYYDGLLVESKLVDVVPGIFLVMTFKNESNQTFSLQANKIKLKFSDGLERYPDQDKYATLTLEPQKKTWVIVKMTKKSDFNSQSFVRVEIPITQAQKTKIYTVDYPKSANYVEKEFFDNTIFDIGVEVGRSFFIQNTKDQTDESKMGSFGLNMNLYWNARHGAILGFKSFDYSLKSNLKTSINPTGSDFRSTFNAGYLGYTYRNNFTDSFSLNTSALLSAVRLEYVDSAATYSKANLNTLGLRLEANHLLNKVDRGVYQGTYLIYYGVDYFHLGSFSNSIGDLSGGLGSAFVGFKIGF